MSEDAADDYRRRCLLLEASLIKFKEKATRVRQLFTVKVPHHRLTYHRLTASIQTDVRSLSLSK